MQVAHYKPQPTQEYPITKIKEKVEPAVIDEYVKSLTAKLPGKLKLFAGILSLNIYIYCAIYENFIGDSVDLPASEYMAGSKIKAITVGVYDKQKPPKAVEKKIIGEDFYVVLKYLNNFFR